MNRVLRLTPDARLDVRSVARWYENGKEGLGRDFLAKVRRAFEDIIDRPKAFPVVHRDMRRAQLHRFPCGVFFVISKNEIVVLGVIDMRRDPKTWKFRRR